MSTKHVKETLTSLDNLLVKWSNEHALAGLAVGVVEKGKLIYFKGLGKADAEKDIDITADTIFRIGSISKTFTAIAVMQLWEKGLFDLDDPVNKYLKTYQVRHRDPGAPLVTIRHLLTHTSGIGETRALPDAITTIFGKLEISLEPDEETPPMGEFYDGELQPEIFPEQKWSYANHAFATLGQLIEDLSGQPFEAYCMEHIFEPLEMFKTDYLLSERVRDELAQGYIPKKGMLKAEPYHKVTIGAAGSVFSSVSDMTKYMTCLMNEGKSAQGQILNPETLRLMWEHQLKFVDQDGFGFGLTFFLPNFGDHLIINHDGGWPGFVSSMFVAPDEDLGVIVFTNTASRAPNLLATEIIHRLLGLELPYETLPISGMLERPHDWPRLCGFYGPKPGFLTNLREFGMFGNEAQVLVKENQLIFKALGGPLSKGVRLYRASAENPLHYKAIDNTGKGIVNILFTEDDAGNIQGMQVGLNVNQSMFYKRHPSKSLKVRLTAIAGLVGGAVLVCLGKALFKKKK